MSEHVQIARCTEGPVTRSSLVKDFRALGIESSMTLIVHSSLGSMGWVCGGPLAVIFALQEVLTKSGTLVMPTHSTDHSDPAIWQNPPVDPSWWETVRQETPAFDPAYSPTRKMGAIPETFRKLPEVLRSNHPQTSFAAWGKQAELITNHHPLESSFGEESPLARVYDLNGNVLLLGVDFDCNSSLHLAEHRAEFPSKKLEQQGAPIFIEGERTWATFQTLNYDSLDYLQIGEAYRKSGQPLTQGIAGYATCLFMPQKNLIEFGIQWMSENRK